MILKQFFTEEAVNNYYYFKVSLSQCNYTFKYCVILINHMHSLYG